MSLPVLILMLLVLALQLVNLYTICQLRRSARIERIKRSIEADAAPLHRSAAMAAPPPRQ